MNWGSFSDFLAMGGYAVYVWGSYAVTLGLMGLEVVLVAGRRRKALEQVARAPGGDSAA